MYICQKGDNESSDILIIKKENVTQFTFHDMLMSKTSCSLTKTHGEKKKKRADDGSMSLVSKKKPGEFTKLCDAPTPEASVLINTVSSLTAFEE